MKKHKWTEQEEETLRKRYPDTLPEELSLLMGMPLPSILAKARNMKLRRSPDYIARVRSRVARQNLQKMNTEQGRERQRNGVREMIRRERLRIKYGLRQRTLRKFSTANRAERSLKHNTRHTARARGYEIDDRAKAVFFTERTRRHERTEQFFKNNGYEIIERPTSPSKQET